MGFNSAFKGLISAVYPFRHTWHERSKIQLLNTLQCERVKLKYTVVGWSVLVTY